MINNLVNITQNLTINKMITRKINKILFIFHIDIGEID